MEGAELVTNLGSESTVMQTLPSPSRSSHPGTTHRLKAGSHQQGNVSTCGNTELGTHTVWTSFWKAAVSEHIHERGFGENQAK